MEQQTIGVVSQLIQEMGPYGVSFLIVIYLILSSKGMLPQNMNVFKPQGLSKDIDSLTKDVSTISANLEKIGTALIGDLDKPGLVNRIINLEDKVERVDKKLNNITK